MDMEKLVALCRRRGFIFQSSEIYGGINGFWDYGPLGVELKRNIKDAWWHDNVHTRDDMVGLDCSIIMHPKVWEASGHVGGFADPRNFNLMFETFTGAVRDEENRAYRRPETAQGIFANFRNVVDTGRVKI